MTPDLLIQLLRKVTEKDSKDLVAAILEEAANCLESLQETLRHCEISMNEHGESKARSFRQVAEYRENAARYLWIRDHANSITSVGSMIIVCVKGLAIQEETVVLYQDLDSALEAQVKKGVLL
jgi:hypothetical protein